MIHVVVLGGGLAGLSAAVRFRSSPFALHLLEATPRLGGRTWSFVHPSSTRPLDNGQHVLMGCYRDTLAFLDALGSTQRLSRHRGLALDFVHRDGRRARLQAGRLPHPFGLAQGFLCYRMLPLSSRLNILRVAWRLRSLDESEFASLDTIDAATWLCRLGQSEDAIHCFWQPLVLAMMNTAPERASARLLAAVLREIFLGDAEAADMLLPEYGLSDIFVEGAARLLRESGYDIQLRSRATRLHVQNGRVRSVIRQDGSEMLVDAVVSAIPPWSLQRLLRDSGMLELLPGGLTDFEPSTILSIHVWLRRALPVGPMTGLLGTTLQWLFDKGGEEDGSRRYSCTISAAEEAVAAMDEAALRVLIFDELRLIEPRLEAGDILRILPVKEKRATFVPAPGLESVRPGVRTSIPNLYLAGDWTATGYPATIEGAVRSGHAAVAAVLEDFVDKWSVSGGHERHPNAH
ncbi:MAG: FAD-dependent oxidoreductase [Bacteroidetes bacterium]|nr:FAD-dependent oxidoreductase [Bacteroidota bacterium]